MTPEQRAMAWEFCVAQINHWQDTPNEDVQKYIENTIIPHLYKKAKALRRKERAKDPRNKTDMDPEL